MNKYATVLLCAALVNLSWSALASSAQLAPLEVASDDSANTVPMSQYLAHLVSAEGSDPQATIAGVQFPMRTQLRSAVLNQVNTRVFDARLMANPLFVLGSDKASAQWLLLNREALRKMAALGVVVQAASLAEFNLLQKLAEGLPLAPANGKWLEQSLMTAGVDVFPLLIQGDGRVIQIVGATP